MNEKINKTDVGIIVGRFMVHELHDAHKDLIVSVKNRHSRIMLFLGLSPLKCTKKNPLDFRNRKASVEESFPGIEIHYIDDNRDDKVWSKNLDKLIEKWTNPGQTVTLYGSRDCFIKQYFGKYSTCELEPNSYFSGTEIRKNIINFYPSSKEFRAGIIAATGLRYPTAYQTVDIAVLNEDNTKVLLVKKPNETKFRFIGGFSDVKSNSLEDDARREVKEETSVEIGNITYIGSIKIKDWRYDGEDDCIKTAFFVAKYVFGRPEGDDDVEIASWFDLTKLNKTDIVEEHHPLLEMFRNYLSTVTPEAKVIVHIGK